VIAIQRQRVTSFPFDDSPGDVALAIECVGRNNRAFQGQELQKAHYRRSLAGFIFDGHLREHQAIVAASGADHVQSGARTIRVGSSAQGLSVDRDDAAAGFAETRDEFLEAPAELVRVEPAEHPAEGVVVR
jgi:hypothetical protein